MYLCHPMNLLATFFWPPIGVILCIFATLYCVQRAKLVIHVVCKKPNEFLCLQRGKLVGSFILCAFFIWRQLFLVVLFCSRALQTMSVCKNWFGHSYDVQTRFVLSIGQLKGRPTGCLVRKSCLHVHLLFFRAVFLYTHFFHRAVFHIHTTVCRAVFIYTHISYARL